MQSNHLHIISFDVPYPADYGGVIDIYYKIKHLNKLGIKVYLHCFKYGRKEATELESICEKVFYYERKLHKKYLLSSLPFIVISRQSEQLMKNLLQDNYPILFEGLHTCFYLNDERITNRYKIVRTHNIEHNYYAALAEVEKNIFKKMFFKTEAKKLKNFEHILMNANLIAAISPNDEKELKQRYKNVCLLNAFHSNEALIIKEGKGEYCLYHGNLGIGENNNAAVYLVREVFSKLTIRFIIAGKNPSPKLKKLVNNYKHIQLINDVEENKMNDLIQNAHINILLTFQNTGVKLKLINALFKGRFCLVNRVMINNTGLEQFCLVKDSPQEIITEIKRLFQLFFTNEQIGDRKKILKDYSNNTNIQYLIKKIPF